MFRIGDKVAHPMHGAGVIDDIVSERVGPASQDYYVFRMPVGGLVLKIPTTKSQLVGLTWWARGKSPSCWRPSRPWRRI